MLCALRGEGLFRRGSLYNPDMTTLLLFATLFQVPRPDRDAGDPEIPAGDSSVLHGRSAAPRGLCQAQGRRREVRAQPAAAVRASRRRRAGRGGSGRDEVLQHSGRLCESDRCRSGRVPQITDDPANRPMFIHCTAAIRVGAFWAIRRALRDGLTTDAALEEGRKVGLVNAPHLEEFARKYIASHEPRK